MSKSLEKLREAVLAAKYAYGVARKAKGAAKKAYGKTKARLVDAGAAWGDAELAYVEAQMAIAAEEAGMPFEAEMAIEATRWAAREKWIAPLRAAHEEAVARTLAARKATEEAEGREQ